jgi:hypothetical protein
VPAHPASDEALDLDARLRRPLLDIVCGGGACLRTLGPLQTASQALDGSTDKTEVRAREEERRGGEGKWATGFSDFLLTYLLAYVFALYV